MKETILREILIFNAFIVFHIIVQVFKAARLFPLYHRPDVPAMGDCSLTLGGTYVVPVGGGMTGDNKDLSGVECSRR